MAPTDPFSARAFAWPLGANGLAGLGVKHHATPLMSTSLFNLLDLRDYIPTGFHNVHLSPSLPVLDPPVHPYPPPMPPLCILPDHDIIRSPLILLLLVDHSSILQLHVSDLPRSLRQRHLSFLQRHNRRILGRKRSAG